MKSTVNFLKNNLTIILIVALVLFLMYGSRQCSTWKYKKIIRKNNKIHERTVENHKIESDARIEDLEKEIETIATTETKSTEMVELEREIESIKTKTAKELKKGESSRAVLLEQHALKDVVIERQEQYIISLREFHLKEKLKMKLNIDKITKEYKTQITGLKGVIQGLKNEMSIGKGIFGGVIGVGGGIKKGPNGLDVGYFLAGVAWGIKI